VYEKSSAELIFKTAASEVEKRVVWILIHFFT
jgi:hypothetical protein